MSPLKPPEGARNPPGCSGSASIMKSVATLCKTKIKIIRCILSKARAHIHLDGQARCTMRSSWALQACKVHMQSVCRVAWASTIPSLDRSKGCEKGTWKAVLLRAWASSSTAWPSHEWRRFTPNAKPSRLPAVCDQLPCCTGNKHCYLWWGHCPNDRACACLIHKVCHFSTSALVVPPTLCCFHSSWQTFSTMHLHMIIISRRTNTWSQ